jgi:precorrin-6Y C5,15-methyltransferase (decarboxylating)
LSPEAADDERRVVVVGLGADGPAGLGPRARQAIEQAELLVGGRRHLAFFADHPAEKLPIVGDLGPLYDRLATTTDRRCTLLASGDPNFFGIGPLLVKRLGRERVEILPGVSSVALAFNRLGLAWQDATVLSVHGRPLEPALGPALRARKLALLTDACNTPSVVAEALLAGGLADCPAYVCERLGAADERIVATRLADLPGREFDDLNLLVLLPEQPPPESSFGRSEDEFLQLRGQITKAEVRAVALAKLRLPPGGLLWDVGAGSGSLAIEAAALMPAGLVMAVERDPAQVEVLRENLGRHRAVGVRVIAGAAPAALEGLPGPDRVFLGGGGAEVDGLAAACLRALAGRGRLVANVATLESVADLERAVAAAGWESELVQVSVARGRAIGGRTRLAALNPVFILTAWPGGSGPG